MELIDNQNKYWIHKVDNSLLGDIDKFKCIGSKYNNYKLFNKIEKMDEIILFTKLNNHYVFYGVLKIEDTFLSDDALYNYYINKTKLKTSRTKYFLEPIFIEDVHEKLTFLDNVKNYSRVLDKEYKEISKIDFNKIISFSTTTGMFPVYFEEYSENMKEFILDSCKSLFNILKYQEYGSQIEITKFIGLLDESLKGYGVNKDFEDLKRFYSRYAHELGFRHVTTRDPKKFVVLLTPSGEKENFGYVSLR